MLVKNLHSPNVTIIGGALNAWKDYKGIKRTVNIRCVRCKVRTAEHGGHVIKAGLNASKEWYIVPLCAHCNELKDDTAFSVPAELMVRVSDLK